VIERHFRKDDAQSSALYSDCGAYRYALTRCWDAAGARLLYIMLNPSRASERVNDPTVERCERRARQLGFGAFRVVNLFAWRATDPRDLKTAEAPVGADNPGALAEAADWADMVLAAWGIHGAHLDQGAAVAAQLRGRSPHHLGLCRNGHPRHPLYVSYDRAPEPWDAKALTQLAGASS
jgi:hypothetical protein